MPDSLIISKFPADLSEIFDFCNVRRQCSPGVRALALRSGDPGFKISSDHWLNLFLVVPSSTSQLHL